MMEISGRKINWDQPPYVVAEISCNHLGDIDNAYHLIDAAKEAGASAVKFQAYEAETITIDCDRPDFIIKDGLWRGRKLYDLYRKTQTPFYWFPALFSYAKAVGITMFASVFDKSSVDMLEKLNCPAYKIASMEIVDIPLIQHAAKTGKPIILSMGMASEEERINAVAAVSSRHGVGPIILHCVSGYPTSLSDADLSGLSGCSGISDHTPGWEIPVAATALGAMMIEKHMTLDRNNRAEDNEFSLEPFEFRGMVEAVNAIWKATTNSGRRDAENASRQLRRSLYVVKDIKSGEVITEDNVKSIRPAYGLPPSDLPRVLGMTAMSDISYGTPLDWGLLVPF